MAVNFEYYRQSGTDEFRRIVDNFAKSERTRDDMVKALRQIAVPNEADACGPQDGHYAWERILIMFINDEEVADIIDGMTAWYA